MVRVGVAGLSLQDFEIEPSRLLAVARAMMPHGHLQSIERGRFRIHGRLR
jgi:hypothetical protein